MPYDEGDPIDSQFKKIWGKVAPGKSTNLAPGTANPAVYNEPIEGNSLIKNIRSINNLTGNIGADRVTEGNDTFIAGLNAFGAPFDFYSKILSGDSNAISSAIGPQARAVDSQFAAAKKAADQGMVRGGARSVQQAELPFKKAGIISDAILKTQPEAAGKLMQIAQLLSSFGLQEQVLGAGLLGQSSQSQLAVRGQDNAENAAWTQMLGQIGGGIGSLFGGLAAGNYL